MQPEISRRCLVCGAAPRAGAQFCPQCGSNLSGRAAVPAEDVLLNDAPGGDAGADEVARAFEEWRGGEAPAAGEPQGSGGAAVSEPPPSLTTQRDVMVEQPPLVADGVEEVEEVDEKGAEVAPSPSSSSSLSSSPSKVAGAVGATRRRAASVVKESIAPRVERVRDRSVVMLEDAPQDSGLRFVVIAGALFALFVLMLVLSSVIK